MVIRLLVHKKRLIFYQREIAKYVAKDTFILFCHLEVLQLKVWSEGFVIT